MSDCIFCKLIAHEIPATLLHDEPELISFRDLSPQAPTHVLIVPRRHITCLNDLQEGDAPLIGKLVLHARQLADELGIAEGGYRLVWNCNEDGGQSVWHIHLHLLGGRAMRWPPG